MKLQEMKRKGGEKKGGICNIFNNKEKLKKGKIDISKSSEPQNLEIINKSPLKSQDLPVNRTLNFRLLEKTIKIAQSCVHKN